MQMHCWGLCAYIPSVRTLVRKVRKYGKEIKVRRHHLQRLELSCEETDISRWDFARRDLEEKRAKDPFYADQFWEDSFDAAGMQRIPAWVLQTHR